MTVIGMSLSSRMWSRYSRVAPNSGSTAIVIPLDRIVSQSIRPWSRSR
jgi:hypothetical protein